LCRLSPQKGILNLPLERGNVLKRCILAGVIIAHGAAWAQNITLAVTPQGTVLAAYRAFFHQVQYLQSVAQTANTAEAAELQGWHQKNIGITASEAIELKQIAAAHLAAVAQIENRASQILASQQSLLPTGVLTSHSALPPLLPALSQLQAQRDDLTMKTVSTLQAEFSSGSFAKLDTWVKAHFSQDAKTPAGSRPIPPSPSAIRAGASK
jgi:hypothetical protein